MLVQLQQIMPDYWSLKDPSYKISTNKKSPTEHNIITMPNLPTIPKSNQKNANLLLDNKSTVSGFTKKY